MITDDGEKWHYLAVKSLSALFRRITSKLMETFTVQIVFVHMLQKIALKN